MRTGITEPVLRRLYTDLGKSDSEIACFFGCDRTAIVRLRSRYNIRTRKSIGEIGEEMILKELRSRGYDVKDMNDKDKLYPYDLLVDSVVRVEVKSATLSNDSLFRFTLTEKPENQNMESLKRIRLGNGRTRKVFSKTCDLIVFVGVENDDCHFFLVKPKEINEKSHGIAAPLNPFSKSKYNKFRERWEVIEEIKKDRLRQQSDPEQNLVNNNIPRFIENMHEKGEK